MSDKVDGREVLADSRSDPGTGQDRSSSSNKYHRLCKRRLEKAISKSAYVRYMLEAMNKAGCTVEVDKHLVCEPCGSANVVGGYDEENHQIVLCENKIYSQGCMNDTLTHELIHAFDHCRAHVDFNNIHHLACTEIRAASLSGECFFWKETFARLKFGWKKHHQACVKFRATQSIMCVRDISHDEARSAVDKVFDTCFKDTVPFERTPP